MGERKEKEYFDAGLGGRRQQEACLGGSQRWEAPDREAWRGFQRVARWDWGGGREGGRVRTQGEGKRETGRGESRRQGRA